MMTAHNPTDNELELARAFAAKRGLGTTQQHQIAELLALARADTGKSAQLISDRKLQKAVNEELATKVWPVAKEGGEVVALEKYEYFEFVKRVLKRME